MDNIIRIFRCAVIHCKIHIDDKGKEIGEDG